MNHKHSALDGVINWAADNAELDLTYQKGSMKL